MRLLKTTLLIFILLFVAASCSKDAIEDKDANYSIDLTLAQQNDAVFAKEVLTLVNAHRTSIGLDTLQLGTKFSSAHAIEHTNYMIDVKQINHHNFDFRSSALKSTGAYQVGENVAFGYETAETVVRAWLNSPGHRDNIEGHFTHSGFGIKKCEERNSYYFTQLFYRE